MKFTYAAEKFKVARRSLMLPFTIGEAEAIASAFHACSLGLHDINDDDLEYDARSWVAEIRELMDTSGIHDPSNRGRWTVKAEQLTNDQRMELSNAIDELANWFDWQDQGER